MDSGTKIESATAESLLATGADHLRQRAATRDLPQERSMKRAVTAFNVLFGPQLRQGSVTEVMGWQFMAVLKMARASAGAHNLDDYVDQAAYSALAGECAEKEHLDHIEDRSLINALNYEEKIELPLQKKAKSRTKAAAGKYTTRSRLVPDPKRPGEKEWKIENQKAAKKPAAKKQGSRGRS